MFILFFFFFNDTATTEIYTLSLHDALPIYRRARPQPFTGRDKARRNDFCRPHGDRRQKRRQGRYRGAHAWRSEEHTSELQSRLHLVCRLLLEKKKKY